MIKPYRFIANKALDFDGWLAARRDGVTATQVGKAATPSGFKEAVAEYRSPTEIPDNPYMAFGREQEGFVSLWLKEEVGIFPNEWLIGHEDTPQYLATPDGISLDHRVISEVKTTGKDWASYKDVPIHYRRQVQWQLYVTGAEECIFAWLLRVESGGRFVPGWFEPKTVSVLRDEKEIDKLVEVADRLLLEYRKEGN